MKSVGSPYLILQRLKSVSMRQLIVYVPLINHLSRNAKAKILLNPNHQMEREKKTGKSSI